MQSNLCVHTKYENMDKIYLYPIWEFFSNYRIPEPVMEKFGGKNKGFEYGGCKCLKKDHYKEGIDGQLQRELLARPYCFSPYLQHLCRNMI